MCVCVSGCLCLCLCICMSLCVYMPVQLCMHVCTCVCMWMCVCVCVSGVCVYGHMHACAKGGQQMASDVLVLELTGYCEPLDMGARNWFWSSGRAASTLSYWAISLALEFSLLSLLNVPHHWPLLDLPLNPPNKRLILSRGWHDSRDPIFIWWPLSIWLVDARAYYFCYQELLTVSSRNSLVLRNGARMCSRKGRRTWRYLRMIVGTEAIVQGALRLMRWQV